MSRPFFLAIPVLVALALLSLHLALDRSGEDGGMAAGGPDPAAATPARPQRHPGRMPGLLPPTPGPDAGDEVPVGAPTETAVLVEGRVIDDLDRPCAGVLLRLAAAGRDLPGRLAGRPAAVRSDRYGRFRLEGPALPLFDLIVEPADETLVATRLRGLGSATRGLEIRLHRAASLAGRLLLPEGVSGDWFRLLAIEADNGRLLAIQAAQPEGDFEVAGLAPGAIRLAIRLIGAEDELVELRGLELEPGLPCIDPRLDAIDLRHLLATFQLEVLDPAGVAVSGARILALGRIESAGGPLFSRTQTDETGHASLPRIAGGLDLEIAHDGFTLLHLEGVEDSRCIILEEAPRLLLLLPAPDLDLPPGIGLEMRFRYGEKRRLGRDDLLANRVPDRIFQVTGLPSQLSFALQAPGDYEIMMSLVTLEGERDEEPVASIWLDLDERPTTRRLPMASRRAEFRRALERLESRHAAAR